MRKASIFLSVLAFCVACLFAQDDLANYQPHMKAAAGARGKVNAAIQAKDVDAAKAAAGDMADHFDMIAKFWQAKGKDDAVKFAETARDAAKGVQSASTTEEQQASFAKAGAACVGCHNAYRDGNKPAFKGM